MGKKLAVLISNAGIGTNLAAIIKSVQNKKINARIVIVISDTKKAIGLEQAKKYNLKTEIVSNKEDLLTILKKYTPDFVCLAGWKQFVLDVVINAFPQKILNLHPGLIPKRIDGTVLNPDKSFALWNKGKLANTAIRNFFDQHATYAGSSIHFLTSEFDFGPILGRCFEKIKPNDSINSLYSRLKIKENRLYVRVLNKLCK